MRFRSARVLAVVLWLAALATAAAQDRPRESLAAIEERVTSLQERLVRATVALRAGPSSGSGVIISAEGLVLTAAHVVGRPGNPCAVRLWDERVIAGQTLGSFPAADLALVKFDPPADLPVASLGDSAMLRRGQWVVATGHPLGVRVGRPAVLRVGRVVMLPRPSRTGAPRPEAKIQTDAPLISGDSGGPLWDLNGNVVAIHSMVSNFPGQFEGISLHVPINQARDVLASLKETRILEPDQAPANSTLGQALAAARTALDAGELDEAVRLLREATQSETSDARPWLLLARAYARQERTDAALDALEQAIARGFANPAELRSDRDFASLADDERFRALLASIERFAGLPGERRSDPALKDAVARIASAPTSGAVRIAVEGRDVAWGTLVSRDGDVLTKASELPAGPLVCVLPDGRRLPATRKAVDLEWDVALLHADGVDLSPVRLGEMPVVGQWAISPDGMGGVAAIGAVGIGKQTINDRGLGGLPGVGSGFMGVMLGDAPEETLRQLGLMGGVRLAQVQEQRPAARAGLQAGDIVVKIDDVAVRTPEEMIQYVSQKRPGDRVTVTFYRGEMRMEATVILTARDRDATNPAVLLSGEVSRMQGPFPEVFLHDGVLRPAQMGGPVLDRTGRCIGMNIARANRTATYAIPAPLLRQIYERLKNAPADAPTASPLAPARPPAPPPAEAPAAPGEAPPKGKGATAP